MFKTKFVNFREQDVLRSGSRILSIFLNCKTDYKGILEEEIAVIGSSHFFVQTNCTTNVRAKVVHARRLVLGDVSTCYSEFLYKCLSTITSAYFNNIQLPGRHYWAIYRHSTLRSFLIIERIGMQPGKSGN